MRRPAVHRLLLVLSIGLAAFALFETRRLRLATDLTELLPSGSPAAADYRAFAERFGGFERVFVLLHRAEDGGESAGKSVRGEIADAVDRFAALVAAAPEVASARSGFEPEDLAYLSDQIAPRAVLHLGDDWRSVVTARTDPATIRRRARLIRQRAASPVGLFDSDIVAADPLGFSETIPALQARSSELPIDAMTGRFVAPDGRSGLVLITPAAAEIDPAGGRALRAALQEAFETISSEIDTPLEWRAVGGPLYAADDERLMRRDLERSLAGSALGCTLLLLAAFGSLRIPSVALAALTVGLIYTAGIVTLGLGTVTAVGVGFAAVLLGLGIDYAIHGAARYRGALLHRADPGTNAADALRETVRTSGAGIAVSALTTAGAFAVLTRAHFRPLRELGFLVAAGVLCMLASTALVGGPLLLVGRPRTERSPGPIWRAFGRMVSATTRSVTDRRTIASILLVGLTATSLFGIRSLRLDPDLGVFRSVDHPARAAERALAERFGVGLETVTVIVERPDLEAAAAAANQIRDLVASRTEGRARITTPTDYVLDPGAAADRIAALGAFELTVAAEQLEAALLEEGLNPAFFATGLAALRALGRGQEPEARAEEPEWVRGSIDRSADAVAVAVQIRAPETTWPDGPPEALLREIRELGPGLRVASIARVGAEIRELAEADLRNLSGLAIAVVGLIVLLSFRGRPVPSVLALLPVGLGSLWSIGLWSLSGRPIDLVSLAVLPIVLGVGIDDGLHVLHAWRVHPSAGIRGAIDECGHALVLTTLTTAVAFGSLATTSVPGLRNAGILTALGVMCCLAATLLALPLVGPRLLREETPS